MDQIYQIKTNIFIEAFDDGALILRLFDRNIFECNLTGLKILTLTDGMRNVQEVSEILAKCFNISQNEAYDDIINLYQHLQTQDIVELQN